MRLRMKQTFPSGGSHMVVTRKDLEELKRLYKASKPGEVFKFKGEDVLHDYAKYLIEFLEDKV